MASSRAASVVYATTTVSSLSSMALDDETRAWSREIDRRQRVALRRKMATVWASSMMTTERLDGESKRLTTDESWWGSPNDAR